MTYSPADETGDEGKVSIDNSTAEPSLVLPLSGRGRSLPPCQVSVQPSSLQFGQVPPGEDRSLTFYIVNESTNRCLVSGVRIGDGSDPTFTMEEIASAEIAPGERLAVPVRFAPTEAGEASGEVSFYVSHPHAEGPERVRLSGIGGSPCLLVEPKHIDFGGVTRGCVARQQKVSLRNQCIGVLTLDRISIDSSAYPWFEVVAAPLPGTPIGPGAALEFEVAYLPTADGEHEGSLAIHFHETDETHVISLRGEERSEQEQTDLFTQQDLPKVDVLWVVDNPARWARTNTSSVGSWPPFSSSPSSGTSTSTSV